MASTLPFRLLPLAALLIGQCPPAAQALPQTSARPAPHEASPAIERLTELRERLLERDALNPPAAGSPATLAQSWANWTKWNNA